MIYQTDFKNEAVPNPYTAEGVLRKWGCYVRALCRMLFEKTKDLSKQDILDFYFKQYSKGNILADCTVQNAGAITGKQYAWVALKDYETFKKGKKIWGVVGRYQLLDSTLKANGQQSHFVELDKNTLKVTFDPWNKEGSRVTKEGKLADLRVFYD